MKTVIGIDQSLSNTGICIATDDGNVSVYETQSIAPKAKEGASRLIEIRDRVRDLVRGNIDFAVIEMPAFSQNGKSSKEVAGLFWILCVMMHERGIQVGVVPSTSVKKWALGPTKKGEVRDKSPLLSAAFRTHRFGEITAMNSDEVDALWMADIALFTVTGCDPGNDHRRELVKKLRGQIEGAGK